MTVRPIESARIEPQRLCTHCLAHATKREAKFVAKDTSGLEWFDCGEHALTNQASHVQLTPIEEWFRVRGLPSCPGGYD